MKFEWGPYVRAFIHRVNTNCEGSDSGVDMYIHASKRCIMGRTAPSPPDPTTRLSSQLSQAEPIVLSESRTDYPPVRLCTQRPKVPLTVTPETSGSVTFTECVTIWRGLVEPSPSSKMVLIKDVRSS